MSDCCDPVPYRRFFNRKEADRRLRNYRRRGLDTMAARLVAFLEDRGVEGKTLLEVGGGVGDLQVELLKAGVSTSVNVELSAGYEDAANELLDAEGLTDRVERRLGDFVEAKDDVDSADIVVLNRVICCYPFMDRMMEAVLAKANGALGIVVPRDRWVSRLLVLFGNAFSRVRGCSFRAFVHPVDRINALAREKGMVPVYLDSRTVWQATVFARV